MVTDTGSEDVIANGFSAGLGPLSRHTKEQGTALKEETLLKVGLDTIVLHFLFLIFRSNTLLQPLHDTFVFSRQHVSATKRNLF